MVAYNIIKILINVILIIKLSLCKFVKSIYIKMKKLLISCALLSISYLTVSAQNESKNILSIRPGFSIPLGDYNELAKTSYNYQIDWQHYMSERKFAVGLGLLNGGNVFDVEKAAQNVLTNIPSATLATVEAGNYRYSSLYGIFTYNLTAGKKLNVELTTRLGLVLSTHPEFSVVAEDAFFYYIDAKDESASALSMYYTGALVLRYPLSDKFDLSLSNELVGFNANYTIRTTDYLNSRTYESELKKNYTALFTSIGLNWKL